ncbi:polysaccharide biosynthesis/export family protein [Rhodoferax sp.]|uniref:polysaccharide biosynthesis/export family protein n=1 Tax=Rhodoferax sp. TaxID=50421 RepID=UPI0039B8709F
MLVGCASTQNWLPSAGASRAQIQDLAQAQPASNIQVVEINDKVARKVLGSKRQALFSEVLDQTAQKAFVIGAGDVIEVSIWEAPPAALFGSTVLDPRAGPATTRATAFPEQMVNVEGFISIPFAGQIRAAGRTTNQIEAEVVQRLMGKANQPQVLVRTIRNNTANVTVVGEVTNSLRMPLTAKGERLLDALAAAGGVRQPVNKMTLQVSRAGQMLAMPLEAVIRDPKQNIVLQPGDVVTSLFQPLSFTVLGATGKNEEVNFETQGISLAQALARAGGLQDARADAQGVFLFRFELPEAMENSAKTALTADGKVPVVYRLDLKDPATFFVAQNFPMQNRDVLYVSNSPATELQKFLNILTSTIYSISAIGAAVRTSP